MFNVGVLVFDVEVDDINPARCGTPSVAGGLKTPGGGSPPATPLGKIVVEVRFWSEMNGQLELLAGTAQL